MSSRSLKSVLSADRVLGLLRRKIYTVYPSACCALLACLPMIEVRYNRKFIMTSGHDGISIIGANPVRVGGPDPTKFGCVVSYMA